MDKRKDEQRSETRDYLHGLYDSLHDSEMQQHFRTIRPMPFGVVFLPWKGMTEEEMRVQFRTMKQLGFHNLKQTMGTPEWPVQRVLEIALEEGVIPFWYGEGGWEPFTDELLDRLEIPRDTPVEEIRGEPRMIEYQTEVIRTRIKYPKIETVGIEGQVLEDAGIKPSDDRDIILGADPELRPDAIPSFKAWVRSRYETIEDLRDAWNQDEVGITDKPYTSWNDFESDDSLSRQPIREYRFVRDILRFKADYNLARIRARVKLHRERDPHEPFRAGGEMGLFLPFVWRGTDMEGIAEMMREAGSFYPSIHFAWHYEEVEYEAARCIYMQSSLAADWFKGGWSATWESTGGPQQLSGGKGWNVTSAEETAGFTVNAGTMSQLLFSYLAGGFRGAGLWCWNFRRAGWEGGEYALLNRQNEPSPRAIRAGRIAQAAERYRDELWQTHKEPEVGVFINWENEAVWSGVSVRGRTKYRFAPVHSRVGASRALMNGNIPWEHVTRDDLTNGLAPRYRTIYLPSHLALSDDILEILISYVSDGGCVVMDAPGGWYDEYGRVLNTGKGTPFEQLFGAMIRDFQYSNNVPRYLRGERLEGFILELEPTGARAVEFYQTGEAAIVVNRLGMGSAVILGFEASHLTFRPGNVFIEEIIRQYVKDGWEPPYACEGALVYRLASPGADHYFFINDAEAKRVCLDTREYRYDSAEDPVTGESLSLGSPISLEAYGGRWVRFGMK
jgi:beta-galactosidase